MEITKLGREVKVSHEAAAEFTLPDYLPAVSRLLSASCRVVPEGIYLSESNGIIAEAGGLLLYTVYWTSDEKTSIVDGEDVSPPAVCSATLKGEYSTSVSLGSFDETPVCRSETCVGGVICRVSGPRRLQIRTKMSTRVMAEVSAPTKIPQECEADGTEMKIASLVTMKSVSGSAHDLLCAVSLPPSTNVLSCDAWIGHVECAAVSASECRCRGKITARMLSVEEGKITSDTASAEFEECVMLDGSAPPGGTLSAFGRIASVDVVDDAASGTRAEVTYALTAECTAPETVSVTADAYNCRVPTSASYKDTAYLTPLLPVSCTLSVNESAGVRASGEGFVTSADAVIDEVRLDSGRLCLTGRVTGTALFETGGGYESTAFSVPWKYDVPCGGDADGELYFRGEAIVASVSCRAGGELEIDAELSINGAAALTRHENVLDSLVFMPDGEEKKRGITVYYPDADEETWDIAKKFRVPLADVATDENMSRGKPSRVIVI
ncbi:MAG: hypothetical protein LUI01_02245 [Firmicutes bacterium]|nr:hypothetical protein [Bacillota bacterium]